MNYQLNHSDLDITASIGFINVKWGFWNTLKSHDGIDSLRDGTFNYFSFEMSDGGFYYNSMLKNWFLLWK